MSLAQFNHALYEKYTPALSGLFEKAKETHFFYYSLSLHPELKNYLDPSWSTLIEGFHLFEEMLGYLGGNSEEPHERRVQNAVSFYVHLATAPMFYQVIANFLRIVNGESFQLNPFQSLRENPFLSVLSAQAKLLGFQLLSEILVQLVDSDLIEAYQSGDYYLSHEGIRLHCSNVEKRSVMTYDIFQAYLERLINFFVVMKRLIDEAIVAFAEPICIEAVLPGAKQAYRWQIGYNTQNKHFQVLQLNKITV